ncbi:uncharacterized protein I303_108199 [Kwoniella dejecticola CBS 10117]|uniref:Uncharacterized protein n=1 Tax=Kwoniella dejecticola CBS 10117 TaxID=1296121 RepID=A0A1A5ZY44_9TREE|nr:uncharacterized protein I303_07475 [Kwoniella dejecticola CBS 10117]OBR82708.1 hypothetical protein I303_07475 [Kwoniella dejecticola CBS 10117]
MQARNMNNLNLVLGDPGTLDWRSVTSGDFKTFKDSQESRLDPRTRLKFELTRSFSEQYSLAEWSRYIQKNKLASWSAAAIGATESLQSSCRSQIRDAIAPSLQWVYETQWSQYADPAQASAAFQARGTRVQYVPEHQEGPGYLLILGGESLGYVSERSEAQLEALFEEVFL